MPGAHRNGDKRFCNASTIVSGQSTVFVNGKLWAVEDDLDSHCLQGALKPIYGPRNVYIENKHIICAIGDAASSDEPNCLPILKHVPPWTWPRGKSPNVKVYEGARAGTATRVKQL